MDWKFNIWKASVLILVAPPFPPEEWGLMYRNTSSSGMGWHWIPILSQQYKMSFEIKFHSKDSTIHINKEWLRPKYKLRYLHAIKHWTKSSMQKMSLCVPFHFSRYLLKYMQALQFFFLHLSAKLYFKITHTPMSINHHFFSFM